MTRGLFATAAVLVSAALLVHVPPAGAQGESETDDRPDTEEELILDDGAPGLDQEGYHEDEAVEIGEVGDIEADDEIEADRPRSPDEWRMIEEVVNSRKGPPKGKPIVDLRGRLMAEHLDRASCLRVCEAHPEWEQLRPADVQVVRLERFEPGALRNVVEMVYLEYKAEGGLHVEALFEERTSLLRFYRRRDLYEAMLAQPEDREWPPPRLRPSRRPKTASKYC